MPHPKIDWLFLSLNSTYAADSAFEMVVAGSLLEDGDVAVMMVEAGGTEATCDVYEAGAPFVDETLLADGLEFSKKLII